MTELLTVISVIFIIAGPFLLLANYLRLPTAPLLIVAGLVAGGFIDPEIKLEMARLGIALLVFTFAVRIQTKDVQTAITDTEVVAFGQMLVVGVLGLVVGLLVGLPSTQAVYLGIAAAVSSSIVGSTLFLPGAQEFVHDKLSEEIHSVQDLTALFLLLVLTAGVFELEPVATNLGYGVILLLLAVATNRYFFDRVGDFADGADESMLIGTVALLLVFLAAAEFMGISVVVGAFAAGIAVQYDPVRYSGIINGLESINDFFAAIFFITVGALVVPDPVALPTADVVLMTVMLVLLAGVVKPAVTIALLMRKGYERRTATLTGFNLDQVGEFALIIAIEALFLGMVFDSVFEAIILAAVITLITSSFTRYYDEKIYHVLADYGLLGDHGESVERWSDVPESLEDHVVIVGYGHHGRRLVEACEENGQSYVVVESNPARIEELEAGCESYVFGDIVEPKTKRKAELTDARLVISTSPSLPVSEHLVSLSGMVDVIVRVGRRREARRFLDKGAFYVILSDLLAADRLEGRLEDLIEGRYDEEELREEVLEADGVRASLRRRRDK